MRPALLDEVLNAHGGLELFRQARELRVSSVEPINTCMKGIERLGLQPERRL